MSSFCVGPPPGAPSPDPHDVPNRFESRSLDELLYAKALALRPGESSLLVDGGGRLQNSEVGVTTNEGRVEHLGFGLSAKWCQMAMFAGKESEQLRRVTWYSPGVASGFEVLNAVIERGGTFRAVACPDSARIVEIDGAKDIVRARSIP